MSRATIWRARSWLACARRKRRYQHTDDQHHQDIGHGSDTEAEEEIRVGDTEGLKDVDAEAGELDEQQWKRGQQGLSAVAGGSLQRE